MATVSSSTRSSNRAASPARSEWVPRNRALATFPTAAKVAGMTVRPRRSVLYMPGSNARALEKAKTLAADGVILDLEDSVAPDAKDTARRQVVDVVKAGGFGTREVFIRVNGVDTPWHADDLSAAAHAAPDAILVPKISNPETLELIGRRLLSLTSWRSRPRRRIPNRACPASSWAPTISPRIPARAWCPAARRC